MPSIRQGAAFFWLDRTTAKGQDFACAVCPLARILDGLEVMGMDEFPSPKATHATVSVEPMRQHRARGRTEVGSMDASSGSARNTTSDAELR